MYKNIKVTSIREMCTKRSGDRGKELLKTGMVGCFFVATVKSIRLRSYFLYMETLALHKLI